MVNLSEIFADVRDPMCVDFCHLVDRGNTLIADRISADVLRRMEPGPKNEP